MRRSSSTGRSAPTAAYFLNLANHSYVEVNGVLFFPNPEAFSYVRQCRDSVRNLVITSATLLVSVGALLATLYSLCKVPLQ